MSFSKLVPESSCYQKYGKLDSHEWEIIKLHQFKNSRLSIECVQISWLLAIIRRIGEQLFLENGIESLEDCKEHVGVRSNTHKGYFIVCLNDRVPAVSNGIVSVPVKVRKTVNGKNGFFG